MIAARRWFDSRGWTPLSFQLDAWAAYERGESGLIHVPTGAGKTYAASLGPIFAGHDLIYLAPLRAMARDIEKALALPIAECGLAGRVESRTGDTSSAARARQKRRPPEVLVTTPESLSLLLTDPDARQRFARVGAVVVDEWHEMIDSKRGTQVELALSRLRAFSPKLRTWALSATLANPEEAAQAVVGVGRAATIVTAEIARPMEIETLLPPLGMDLPWAGHLGVKMADALVDALDPSQATLCFVNTRSQAERWFQEIVVRRPEWFEVMGLHHGSIEMEERARVEAGLKSGAIRIVVCTASLDLGVDLAPVERVVQIGSPKGIARLVQRAGRSGHRPGATSRVLCVPTHALQLVEIAAVREALALGEVEPRRPLAKPLDVLSQHLVTCGLGGGFRESELLAEVRTAFSYRDLSDEEWSWAMALVRDGGATLAAYSNFRKLKAEGDEYGVPDLLIARQHRASVGTIVGDAAVRLKLIGGGDLGTIDENFVSRLKKGERFVFAGRLLEFVMMRELTAYAKPSARSTTNTPHWPGNKLPISGSLGAAVRRTFQQVRARAEAGDGAPGPGTALSPELHAAEKLFAVQSRLSRLPDGDTVLAEITRTEEGQHLFLFPFEGRRVHEGLAALLALRVGRIQPTTFRMAVNDYGVEFMSPVSLPWADLLVPSLFSEDHLLDDILASADISVLMRKRFREIARVAGLVFPGLPGAHKSMRQVHASTSLLFDVFMRHEPDSLLLVQARREVVEQHFERERLTTTLARLRERPVEIVHTAQPTPLSFPLLLERLAVDSQSSETLESRVARMKAEWVA